MRLARSFFFLLSGGVSCVGLFRFWCFRCLLFFPFWWCLAFRCFSLLFSCRGCAASLAFSFRASLVAFVLCSASFGRRGFACPAFRLALACLPLGSRLRVFVAAVFAVSCWLPACPGRSAWSFRSSPLVFRLRGFFFYAFYFFARNQNQCWGRSSARVSSRTSSPICFNKSQATSPQPFASALLRGAAALA